MPGWHFWWAEALVSRDCSWGIKPTSPPPISRERAAERLAEILCAELGVETDATAVRMMLAKRWHLISPLAHIVHDEALQAERGGGERQ